jgi:hypothetical protein
LNLRLRQQLRGMPNGITRVAGLDCLLKRASNLVGGMPLRAMMALVKVLLFDKGLCFLDDRDGIIFVRAIRSGRFSNDILTVQGLREPVEIFVCKGF